MLTIADREPFVSQGKPWGCYYTLFERKTDFHYKQFYWDERQSGTRRKYKYIGNKRSKSYGKPHQYCTNSFLPICDVLQSSESFPLFFKPELTVVTKSCKVTCKNKTGNLKCFLLNIQYQIIKSRLLNEYYFTINFQQAQNLQYPCQGKFLTSIRVELMRYTGLLCDFLYIIISWKTISISTVTKADIFFA